MSYTNYPSADAPQQAQPPKDNRKVIYTILITALVATWAFIIYDITVTHKNNSDEKAQLETKFQNVDSARNALQAEYNDELRKADSLIGNNTQLKGQLAEKKTQIDKLREQIKSELASNKKDLSAARELISQLKGQVTDLFTQIDQLKQQNQQLTAANQQLTVEKDTLTVGKQHAEQSLAETAAAKAHVEDLASTLHASGVNITAVQVKHNGKEVETSKAKRADLFKVSFQLDENRVAPSGSKDLYVCVTGPDGKPITMPSNGSGSFTTRDEGDKVFTKQVSVQYTQGQAAPVSFDWKPENGHYQEGSYKIQIYQNGFKIGEGTKTLKKAGFLG
jgi:regulator of replication initiation timing